MTTTLKYTHLPLGKEVEAFAGYYTPVKEAKLNYGGREVLYVTGQVVVEATCAGGGEDGCRAANYWYAMVPGFLLRWQSEKNENGHPVSEVEQIMDLETKTGIKRLIIDKESVSQVDFR